MKKLIIGIIALSVIAAIYHFITPSTAIVNRMPSGGTTVCFGDSLTYGTGASKGMDYPAQLSRMIGLPVMNSNVFDGIMGTRSLMSDPIHPNSQGYTVMAQHFFRALQPYL
jgi:lysophospholipase L1-like esterase